MKWILCLLLINFGKDSMKVELLNSKREVICRIPEGKVELMSDSVLIAPDYLQEFDRMLEKNNLTHGILSFQAKSQSVDIYIMSIASSWLPDKDAYLIYIKGTDKYNLYLFNDTKKNIGDFLLESNK